MHELYSPVIYALREHTSLVDEDRDNRSRLDNYRVLQVPRVQHPRVVFSFVACMPGNLDSADVFGSCVCDNEEAW